MRQYEFGKASKSSTPGIRRPRTRRSMKGYLILQTAGASGAVEEIDESE